MLEGSSSTENPRIQETARIPSKRLRGWLIIISILASLLFLIDVVLGFTIISTSVEHHRTGSRSISTGMDMTIPYTINDYHNDLEVEIPSIIITFIILVAGAIGGWVLRKRKPKLAFVLSLLVLVSFLGTFLLGLILVFS